jgi:SAM-dependent methyltransferase
MSLLKDRVRRPATLHLGTFCLVFFDTVILQAISRRFHRHVDDAMLDRCAVDCGCAPVGRLCLLDDEAVSAIAQCCGIQNGARVLDMGCGRGFLGRWLSSKHIAARYTGVDRDEEAAAAARRLVPSGTITQGDFRTAYGKPSFDIVTAFEITIAGAIDPALLDAAAGALFAGGTFALTIASLDGAHVDRLAAAETDALSRFTDVTIEDWTQRAEPFARRTFEWWLDAPWPPEIQEKSSLEARAALKAIARGSFHYAVLFAKR